VVCCARLCSVGNLFVNLAGRREDKMALQDFVHDKLCGLCARHPKKSITYAWFLALVYSIAPLLS
jgi:hypothetical protein